MKKLLNPIYVTKSFLPPLDEYINEIKFVWESNWLTNNGHLHNSFEKEVNEFLKVQNVTLFVNGTLALECAIKALELSGEIITTPFTFAATIHSIARNNIKPVFCDIEPNTFNIDVNKIEELITEKTTAIMPVHVFGNPCDVNKIEKIAKEYNLKVIYDAAHAFGVEIEGKPIGTFGDISMFSLHATKVFHSIEGGLLSYRDPNLKNKFNLLKNFGISGPETIELIGTNAKMNEFQAAMGLVNLRYINKEIEDRKRVASIYRELLKNVEGIRYLNDIDGVKHNYSYFPILVEAEFGMNRNQLHDKLAERNIFTRKYFYPLCSNFECYKDFSKKDELIVANNVAEKVLTLPIYGSLKDEEVMFICNAISEIQKNFSR